MMSPEDVYEQLQEAVRSGDLGRMRELLDEGAVVPDPFRCPYYSLLCTAVIHNQTQAAQLLIEDRGANINASYFRHYAYAPLHFAACYNKAEMAQLLLAHSANVDLKNEVAGKTALHYAAIYGATETAQQLLHHSANVLATDSSGKTALHLAAEPPEERDHQTAAAVVESLDTVHQIRKMTLAQLLVKYNANVNAVDDAGNTPLHLAVENREQELVQFLVDQGADVNKINENGETPLLYAFSKWMDNDIEPIDDHLNIIKFMLELGVEADASDKHYGLTMLHLVMLYCHDDVGCEYHFGTSLVQLLLDQGVMGLLETPECSGKTPLHFAANEGKEKFVELLLDQEVHVDCVDEEGKTPLHYAAMHVRAASVRLLLDRGANVHVVDSDGKTALHLATTLDDVHGIVESAQCLLDKGASVTVCDTKGRTPFHDAVMNNSTTMIHFLLEQRGANVNGVDNEGNTPLHFAVEHKDRELVQTLLNRGAMVNKPNGNGETPLFFAVSRWCDVWVDSNLEFIRFLVEQGAEVDVSDRQGQTMLHHIVRFSREFDDGEEEEEANDQGSINEETPHLLCSDFIQFLIDQGLNIEATDNTGRTPLHWAAEEGKAEFVLLLLSGAANMDAVDMNNLTPLYYAARSGNCDLVQMLLQRGALASR